MKAQLLSGLQQLNLSLSETQVEAFERYSQELMSWNQRVNLTGIVEPTEIAIKHFLDSISVCQALQNIPPFFSMIDIGSGAGFPGLPLKIVYPEIQLTLLESVIKKTAFLQHVIHVLNLTNVTILTARAEEAGHLTDHRERYDVAVARAVAKLPTLAEYSLPLVKVGGWVIVQKGQNPSAEVAEAAKALKTLGGQLCQILPITVPGLEAARHLITIQKRKPTPKQYPRRPGLPLKKPII